MGLLGQRLIRVPRAQIHLIKAVVSPGESDPQPPPPSPQTHTQPQRREITATLHLLQARLSPPLTGLPDNHTYWEPPNPLAHTLAITHPIGVFNLATFIPSWATYKAGPARPSHLLFTGAEDEASLACEVSTQ